MKSLLLFLFLSTLIASAQLAITNNVKVQLTTNDDNALRLAWKLDSNSRTNGLAPYTVATNALTYAQWQDSQGTEAFQRLAAVKNDENFTQIAILYRNATDADRAKVARILAGLSN